MALFRRARPKGRHALGAAVTSIPSGPPAAVSLAAYLPAAVQPEPAAALLPAPPAPFAAESAGGSGVLASIAELIATGEAWATDLEEFHALHAPEVLTGPPVHAPARPRVQLGFRDGTSTTLEAGSDQSRALEELAQSLTRRD